MKTFISNDIRETFNLAKNFTQKLKGNETVALIGKLGSGKTAFTQGMARALKIKQNVSSPTFNILKIYNIPRSVFLSSGFKLCHIDAYRLKKGKDLLSLGIKDYFLSPKTITVIEWAENIKDILPSDTIFIKFTSKNKNQRIITFSKF